jgi:hypothetical protein
VVTAGVEVVGAGVMVVVAVTTIHRL